MPDGQKLSRTEQIERANRGETVRIESDSDSELSLDEPIVSIQERQEIPMPELTPGSEYLVAFLHSAGTATATGMGLTGLSWQEIEAWVRCNDMQGIVTTRDLKTMHLLSRVYAREYAAASEKGAKPPYVPPVEIEAELREDISNKVDDLFESLLSAQDRSDEM